MQLSIICELQLPTNYHLTTGVFKCVTLPSQRTEHMSVSGQFVGYTVCFVFLREV